MPKETTNLFSWITQIKRAHNSKIFPPTSDQDISRVQTAPHTKNEKKSIIFTKYFKGNNMPFHRPHGLIFKKHDKNQSTEATTEAPLSKMDSECTCCSQGCCSNTSRHRHSTTSLSLGDSLDQSACSQNSYTSTSTDTSSEENRRSSTDTSSSQLKESEEDASQWSSRRTSKTSSLLLDEPTPIPCYKKLKEDGDLVDYDDIVEQDEVDYTDHVVLRSAICNSLVRLALNGPFQSPLDLDGKKQVLHIGCGNGDWCVDIAKLFPKWLVVGMDDKSGSPIRDHRKVPKNFKYLLCYHDLLQTLTEIPDESFDLVYSRFMMFYYNEDDYKQFIKECHRICKPGGFIESYELNLRIYGNPRAGPVTYRLNSKVMMDMEQRKLNPRLARNLGDMVSHVFNTSSQVPKETDSENTKNRKKDHFNTNYTSLPLGIWGGRLGVMFRDDMYEIFSAFEEVSEQVIDTVNREIEIRKSFMNLHYVYAQKNPMDCLQDLDSLECKTV